VLEHAEAARLLHERLDGPEAVAVDDHDLARFDVAHEAGADDVESAALGGEDPGILQAADHEGTHAHRIPNAQQRLVGEQQQRVGALDPAQRIDQPVDNRGVVGAGDQVIDDFSVGGRLEQAADPHQFLAQEIGVGEIAVMRERQTAEIEVGEDRLDVAVRRAAGRGVPVVADRRVADQLFHDGLGAEDVSDQASGAMIVKDPAIVGYDPGGFLPAVLQGMEAKRGVRGGIRRAVDAEQRTFLVKLVEVVFGAFQGGMHGGVIAGVSPRGYQVRLTAAVWFRPERAEQPRARPGRRTVLRPMARATSAPGA
jgi:hypothetical protein